MRPLAALLLPLPLLAASAHPFDPDITAQRVLLEGAKQSRGAFALDGSSPLYYAKNATSAGSQRRYHIYLEGGGWCQSTASCAKRAKSALGSSSAAYHPPTLALPSGCVSAAAPSARLLRSLKTQRLHSSATAAATSAPRRPATRS